MLPTPVLPITAHLPSDDTSTAYDVTPVEIFSLVSVILPPSIASTAAPFSSRCATDGRRIEDELAAHRGAPGEHPRLEQAARLRFDARVPLDRAGRGEVARDALDSSPFDPPAALVAHRLVVLLDVRQRKNRPYEDLRAVARRGHLA